MPKFEFDASKPIHAQPSIARDGDLRWPLTVLCLLVCFACVVVAAGAFLIGAARFSLLSLAAALVAGLLALVLSR